MGLESPVNYVNDLNVANPLSSDEKQEGDNHIRNIKTALKATFAGMAGAFARTQSKGAGFTAALGDNSSLFVCTTSLTIAFQAAATLTNGWHCAVYAHSGTVTLDPDGTELIGGAATLAVPAGAVVLIWCDGTAFRAAFLSTTDIVTPLSETLRIGKHSMWVPASAMTPQFTNGPSVGVAELATNEVMMQTLDFDAVTQEYAQFEVQMPKSWDEGTFTFVAVWSHPTTTTNFGVAWGLAAKAASNDAALDAAFGTAVYATDTGGTTNDLYQTAESGAVTASGTPATNDVVQLRVTRNPSNGSDTLAVDARLHGVMVFYTLGAGNDA